MGKLNLPEGAEAGFRLLVADEFGLVFTMHLYGAGRRGWFLLHSRYAHRERDPGPQPLGKGQWRTLLGLVGACHFWELPELLPVPPEIESGRVTVDGGGHFSLAGRQGERYHHIHRVWESEPGLASVLRFCQRTSGLFEPPEPRLAVPVSVATNTESSTAPEPGAM